MPDFPGDHVASVPQEGKCAAHIFRLIIGVGLNRSFCHARPRRTSIPDLHQGIVWRIFNQMTETHRLIDLAKMISELTGAQISHVANPRKEADINDLSAENRHLLDLGLKPTTLSAVLMQEISEIAKKYAANCDRSRILCLSRW